MDRTSHLKIAAVLLLVAGCHGKADGGPRVGFYLVQEPAAVMEDIELASTPLLTEDDIVEYAWAEHRITLTDKGIGKLPDSTEVGVGGKPFVLVVDGKRCYLGAFWTGLSSASHSNPVIDVSGSDSHAVTIERAYPTAKFGTGDDPRPDKRLQKVLTELKKLK